MTIHDFDMARYLSGSEVEEVYAACAVRVDPRIGEAGDVDTAVITLKFKNGAIGTIDNSRQAVYGYDQRAEVFGSKGVVATADITPDTAVYGNTKVSTLPNRCLPWRLRYAKSFVTRKCVSSSSACAPALPRLSAAPTAAPRWS